MSKAVLGARGALVGVGFIFAVASVTGFGCQKSEAPAPAPKLASAPSAPSAHAPAAAGAISPAAAKEAEAIFNSRCVTCHGQNGKGDGPASAGLQPPPRDFTSHEWQASVTDEYLEKIIKFGGAAVGKSPMMPANPDLTSKPEVVAAVRAHVRQLGK